MNKFLMLVLLCVFTGNFIYGQVLNPMVDSIPMRDGKKLAADIYLPQGSSGNYPVILIQTPYNRLYYRYSLPLGYGLNLSSSPYAFVIVDWRCFYGSNMACTANPKRGEDGYDCVEWIAAQSWCNGKIGTWGPSALGKIQFQTAKENPPHLSCICPLVAGSQMSYSEYYPGGVYRDEYIEQLDNLGYGMSTFLRANPVYNTTWQYAEALNYYPQSVKVPAFMIGGWYDHNVEVMLDLFNGIKQLSPVNVKDKHKLLMGPWAHGGFGLAHVGSSQQGELDFPNAQGVNDSLALRFFNFYLRSVSNGWDAEPVVKYYQLGDNSWNSTSAWPTAEVANTTLYLTNNNQILLSNNSAADSYIEFTYDPRNPSPTIGGPTLRNDLLQGPYNQSTEVESRSDIVLFSTPTLTQDVALKGNPKVILQVSTNRFDTDFALRFCDVYPDGTSMLVCDGIRRMRFRNGYTAADTLRAVPNQIYELEIELPATSITFKAGHKIRVDVSSSNFPRFDRNLNNGGPMYTAGDTLIATNRVYTGSSHPSQIVLPVQSFPSEEKLIISANSINLYYNQGYIYCTAPDNVNTTIQLIDVFGRVIMHDKFAGSKQIDVSHLTSGLYLATTNGGKVFKFVIPKE